MKWIGRIILLLIVGWIFLQPLKEAASKFARAGFEKFNVEPTREMTVVKTDTTPVDVIDKWKEGAENEEKREVDKVWIAMGRSEKNDKAYIKRFAHIATIEQEKYGVPASISLAQGLLESGAGKSKMARKINNHFGMKCFAKHCQKGHCMNFHDDTHKDFFIVYKSAWASWRAHSILLTNDRYISLIKDYNDPKSKGTYKNYKAFAFGLKRKGYATSKTYAYKLIALIQRYKLYRLDNL